MDSKGITKVPLLSFPVPTNLNFEIQVKIFKKNRTQNLEIFQRGSIKNRRTLYSKYFPKLVTTISNFPKNKPRAYKGLRSLILEDEKKSSPRPSGISVPPQEKSLNRELLQATNLRKLILISETNLKVLKCIRKLNQLQVLQIQVPLRMIPLKRTFLKNLSNIKSLSLEIVSGNSIGLFGNGPFPEYQNRTLLKFFQTFTKLKSLENFELNMSSELRLQNYPYFETMLELFNELELKSFNIQLSLSNVNTFDFQKAKGLLQQIDLLGIFRPIKFVHPINEEVKDFSKTSKKALFLFGGKDSINTISFLKESRSVESLCFGHEVILSMPENFQFIPTLKSFCMRMMHSSQFSEDLTLINKKLVNFFSGVKVLETFYSEMYGLNQKNIADLYTLYQLPCFQNLKRYFISTDNDQSPPKFFEGLFNSLYSFKNLEVLKLSFIQKELPFPFQSLETLIKDLKKAKQIEISITKGFGTKTGEELDFNLQVGENENLESFSLETQDHLSSESISSLVQNVQRLKTLKKLRLSQMSLLGTDEKSFSKLSEQILAMKNLEEILLEGPTKTLKKLSGKVSTTEKPKSQAFVFSF